MTPSLVFSFHLICVVPEKNEGLELHLMRVEAKGPRGIENSISARGKSRTVKKTFRDAEAYESIAN